MEMDLEVTDLYADKTWVDLDAVLTPEQKQDLLVEAQEYYEGLGLEEMECEVDLIAPVPYIPKLFDALTRPNGSKYNKALTISADFEPYTYRGVISISTFAASTVVSVYKTLSADGEKIFVLNHSAEARRRTVISRLKNIEAIDRFFLIDKSIDVLAEFVGTQVKSSIMKSLPAPEFA